MVEGFCQEKRGIGRKSASLQCLGQKILFEVIGKGKKEVLELFERKEKI